MNPLEARALFPVVEKEIYLQHAGQSPLSTRSREAVERVARELSESMDWGEKYQEDWEGLRTSLADLVNVHADQVALTRGTGHGLSILGRGLDWREGDNVVGVRGEYPANTFPWTLLKRDGVEFRPVDCVDGRVQPEALLDQVDDRTRVVSLSWIQFWSGFRSDIERIGRECRSRNVIVSIDGIQGVGAIQLDATAAGIDVLACGATKWLLGPSGIGFCYVSEKVLDQLVPPLIGVGTMVLTPEVPYEELEAFHPSARRFEESSVSWLDIAAFAAGVEIINEVGIEIIEERVLSLSRYIGEGLAARGYRMVEPWPRKTEESSGIVSFRPGTPADEAVKILADGGITARLYRDIVRFSTQFFNTEDELDTVLNFVEAKIQP